MNRLNESSSLFATRANNYGIVAIIATITVTSFMMGCGKTDESAATPATATGQTSSAQTGAIKPTAEQEAARKRGMAQGAAMHAAQEAGRQGK